VVTTGLLKSAKIVDCQSKIFTSQMLFKIHKDKEIEGIPISW